MRILTLIHKLCLLIERSTFEDKKALKILINFFDEKGRILKSLRMNANGRISDMANQCQQILLLKKKELLTS